MAVFWLLLAAAALSLSYSEYYQWFAMPGEVEIKINSGASAISICRELKNHGLIHSSLLFKYYLRQAGQEKNLKPGNHKFQTGWSYPRILEELLQERIEYRKITIPEGSDIKKISRIVAEAGFGSPEVFCSFAAAGNFPGYDLLGRKNGDLEGFLFPQTYLINKELTLEAVLTAMLTEFEKNFQKAAQAKISTLVDFEVLILASIIELEAVLPEEKCRISGVFHNRLAVKKPLESCATIQYALGNHHDRILFEDLKVQSPYNTYLNPGLPPGPICSPGFDSIYAAFHPEQNEFFYFISTGREHHFSKNLKEHNEWKRKLKLDK
ncbi:MAG: endolytic transglycosylase MltG [Candidatus Wallbacteria bacterium]|nr:endolytic transglycosylase MltG [Candidatus Wallbacteria bacterium]